MNDAASLPTTIPAGSLFTISSGEYSDYSVHGVFRARADINPLALRDEWLTDHPAQREPYSFNDHEFLAWVTKRGLLEPVDSLEWHLTDYSTASEMSLRA